MHLDRKAILSAAVVAVLSQSSVTFGDIKFWDGPANNLWNNGANWFGGEPGAVDTAVFDGNNTVERSLVVLGADRTVQTVEVQGVPSTGEYNFVSEGGVLTTGHLDVQTGAGSITFEGFKMNTQSMTVQPGATLNLTTNNAQLNASHLFIQGALNWTGGGLTTSNPSGINVDGGVMTVTAGGRGLANGTSLHVYNGGTFTSNNYFDIGSSLDAGNGPTGTLSVSGTGSKFVQTGGLGAVWGHNAGDHANVNISDGGLADLPNGLDIATNHGSAEVLVQTGGELRVGNVLEVGVLSGSLQTGPGAGARVRTGGGGGSSGGGGGGQLAGTSGGFANINISGGTFNCINDAIFGNGSTVNVTGVGVLRLGGNTTFSTGSTFNGSPSGGLSRANNTTLAFDGGVGTFQPILDVADGQTLRITNGGSFTAVERLRLATFSGAGTLLVDGPNSLFQTLNTAASFSNFAQNGGASATITISNNGVASFASGVQMASNLGSAALNIDSAGLFHAPILAAGGLVAGSANINVNGGTLRTTGDTDINGGATLNFAAGTVNIGGTLAVGFTDTAGKVLLTPGGNKVLRVGGLSIPAANGGKIDLNDNDMIVGNFTTKATVQGYINSARNGGDWNGTSGITSTAAKNSVPKNKTLGVLSGAEYTSVGGTGLFSGQPYVATDTLVKFTWYGDTDFNGQVNFDDYGRTDAGFNLGRTGWLNGDFDANGAVDFDDYGLIDLAFNTQGGTVLRAIQFLDGSDRSMSGMSGDGLAMVVQHFNEFGQPYANSFLTAVPEPSAIALLAPIGAMLARRRRTL